jgi:hypothetical protein
MVAPMDIEVSYEEFTAQLLEQIKDLHVKIAVMAIEIRRLNEDKCEGALQ